MKIFYFSFIIMLSVHICFAQDSSSYRIFFTTQSAKIDTINSPEAESQSVTYTVLLDLNGDKKPERFEADGVNCGSGGCPWTIYDGKTNKEMGTVEGVIVYILKEKTNGFPLIETYWKMGCCEAAVHYYAFDKKNYKETKHKKLNEKEMEEYIDDKPSISDEFKELP